eukprot:UN26091
MFEWGEFGFEKKVISRSLYGNGFVAACEMAYNYHIPLCLSPDDIWTIIIQGVSKHIELNAEDLRDKFVKFAGKQKLVVDRDDFKMGSTKNDWGACFIEWAEKIEENIGIKNTNTLLPLFSTTGFLEASLHSLSLMDAMKSYFDYVCRSRCGIPKVKLLGTLNDWKQLKKRVQGLEEYKLGWWVNKLIPVMDQFIKTYEGKGFDKRFWETIYKTHEPHMSGESTTVDGWITLLFPYTKGNKKSNTK